MATRQTGIGSGSGNGNRSGSGTGSCPSLLENVPTGHHWLLLCTRTFNLLRAPLGKKWIGTYLFGNPGIQESRNHMISYGVPDLALFGGVTRVSTPITFPFFFHFT